MRNTFDLEEDLSSPDSDDGFGYVRASIKGTIYPETSDIFYTTVQKALDSAQDLLPILINSDGGDLNAMLQILDIMEGISPEVLRFCTINCGMAASAAGPILASGSPGFRLALPRSKVMVHDLSMGTFGSYSDVTDALHQASMDREILFNALDTSTSKTPGYWLKQVNSKKENIWLNSDLALKEGFIDTVGVPVIRVSSWKEVEIICHQKPVPVEKPIPAPKSRKTKQA